MVRAAPDDRLFAQAGNLVFDWLQHAVFAGFAVVIDQQVPRQPQQPCPKSCRTGLVASEPSINSQKDVLREVARVFRVPRESITSGIHYQCMRPNQGFPRAAITVQAPFDQRCIALSRLAGDLLAIPALLS